MTGCSLCPAARYNGEVGDIVVGRITEVKLGFPDVPWRRRRRRVSRWPAARLACLGPTRSASDVLTSVPVHGGTVSAWALRKMRLEAVSRAVSSRRLGWLQDLPLR